MYRIIGSQFGFWALLLIAPLAASAAPITVDTVLVGDAGNANSLWGYGAVADDYRIGTYEVTNDQYAEFLNAKAASDPLGLYNTSMDSDLRGGITRSGVDGGYTYTVKSNMGNKPVNYVNGFDSLRFANWLHNGQGAGSTESGAYELQGNSPLPSNAGSIVRDGGAIWFLPNDNEWYKAAYYQPAAQGGDASNYWLYATASNADPMSATANAVGDISNPGANVANYNGDADWNGQDGNVTTVGSAGASSNSFYGTADQTGNVWEWNESMIGANMPSIRGGGLLTLGPSAMSSMFTYLGLDPTTETFDVGFRVATIVPEPSSLALLAFGMVSLYLFRGKRR